MNTRIALLIKWIKNPESVTRKEIVDNANAAIVDGPIINQTIITQAAVAAADSVVSAARNTNKVANKKLSQIQYNKAVGHVNAYLSTNQP